MHQTLWVNVVSQVKSRDTIQTIYKRLSTNTSINKKIMVEKKKKKEENYVKRRDWLIRPLDITMFTSTGRTSNDSVVSSCDEQ